MEITAIRFRWRLIQDDNILVDQASQSARLFAQIFAQLEDANNIHVVSNGQRLSTRIVLPRLQLEFGLTHQGQHIRSRQYRGMILDLDQSIGTLVGLQSVLVLRCMRQAQDRLMLIPVPRSHGSLEIHYTNCIHTRHTKVEISKREAYKVYAYSLDSTLGRIVDQGNLHSKLLLAYLHALTSHCLPDSFTGYTGTESALRILGSAAVRSFHDVGSTDVSLLEQIAALSPVRSFYPKHLMDMQDVQWDSQLPTLSQHHRFRLEAQNIVREAQKMCLFEPSINLDISDWVCSNNHLEHRELIRSSTYRTYTFGAEEFSQDFDIEYPSRDVCTDLSRGHRAFRAATLILRDDTALSSTVKNLKEWLVSKHFGHKTIMGYKSNFEISSLKFDSRWIENHSDILTESWCDLHKGLSSLNGHHNKFFIATWLATMAFAPTADMIVIETLAAIHGSQNLRSIEPPPAICFDLSRGERFVQSTIRAIIDGFTKKFCLSSESRMPKQDQETCHQHRKRIFDLFSVRRRDAVQAYIVTLQAQWPCAIPTIPTKADIDEYINVRETVAEVMRIFKQWFDNRSLLAYVQEIATAVHGLTVVDIPNPIIVFSPILKKEIPDSAHRLLRTESMFENSVPITQQISTSTEAPKVLVEQRPQSASEVTMVDRLQDLCNKLQRQSGSKCEKDYVDNLIASCTSLKFHEANVNSSYIVNTAATVDLLSDHLIACKQNLDKMDVILSKTLSSGISHGCSISMFAQHSPRVSSTLWLSQLCQDRFDVLSEPWKRAIVQYGLAITRFHRAQRLVALSDKSVELLEELRHVGHTNWDPLHFPETLLLEVESKIMLRPEQEYIASQMRNPKNGQNVVVQLLMGAGKSSTIVPAVAANLANGRL